MSELFWGPGLTGLLILGVVLVNGWTDAPNAIATAVASEAIGFRPAVGLSALCNFMGVWLTSFTLPAVANTIYFIVDFGSNHTAAVSALSAAMLSIILWAVLAWRFGIPTSESHALIAGITGAAVALQGSFSAISTTAWVKILFGLLFSVLTGFLLGGWAVKPLPHRANYRKFQIGGLILTSFFHGGQDGQKFIGIFLLGLSLAKGNGGEGFSSPPLWLIVLISAVMALGTLMGGRRIIDKVCRDMTTLPPREAFAADLGAGCSLAIATLLGLPVSTTHVKTAAVLGAGMASGLDTKTNVARHIGLMWLLTFPACFGLGWLAVRLIL